MMRTLVITFLMNAAVLRASGFDDMILWEYDLPGDSAGVLNLEPSRVCRNGMEAVFLHCRPYSIGSLGWNTAVARYGFGGLGFYGEFLSYGYEEYYTRYAYSGGIALRIANHLYASGEADYRNEKFLDVGAFGRMNLGLKASYNPGGLAAVFGLSNLTLGSDYGLDGGPFVRPWAAVSYSTEGGINVSASLRRTENARTRWLFQQQIGLSSAVDLHIGILNRPNVLYGGFDFSYRHVTLLLTYYSVGRLNDTIVLGLAAGS